MNTLLMTVGLPRSGKSTWARKQFGVPIVNPDSIRLAMHGHQFIKSAEPFVWATASTMVEALFLAGHPTVILDATNVTRATRLKHHLPNRKIKYFVFGNNSKDSVAICTARVAKERDAIGHAVAKDLMDTIVRMADFWESPDREEVESVLDDVRYFNLHGKELPGV